MTWVLCESLVFNCRLLVKTTKTETLRNKTQRMQLGEKNHVSKVTSSVYASFVLVKVGGSGWTLRLSSIVSGSKTTCTVHGERRSPLKTVNIGDGSTALHREHRQGERCTL